MSLSPEEVKFHDDAAEGRTAQVLAHIRNGVNLDSRNPSGGTALMIAAKRGAGAVVSELLKAGANPNIALHKVAYRALHTAAQEGHVSIMRELIDNGAEVDAATEYGETALISAAFSGQEAACRLLLERGADPAARDSNGNTAAKWAAKKGHYALAYMLWRAKKVVVPRSTPTGSPGGAGEPTDAIAASTDHDAADLSALLRRIDRLNNQLIGLAQMGALGANRGLINELTAAIRALAAHPTDGAAARAASALGDATQAFRNFGFPEAAELGTAASEVLKSMGDVAHYHIRRGLRDPDPDVQEAFRRI